MKFFSRLFSDKESGNAGDGSEPETSEGGTASASTSATAPVDTASESQSSTSSATRPVDREPPNPFAAPARPRSRTPIAVAAPRTVTATTVTMPPQPQPAPAQKVSERPLFAPPTPATKPAGTLAPPPTATVPPTPRKPLASPASSTAPQRAPLTTAVVAPAPRRRKTRPSIERVDDAPELDGEIDAAIDDAQVGEDAAPTEGKLQNDAKTEAEVRALFGRIAAQHVAHVRDFVIELGLAPTGKAWLAICRPAVASLRRAAERIRFVALVAATDAFAAALEAADQATGTTVDGPQRADILARYADLVKLLPDAFDTKTTQDQREPIVVHALLAKVPGLGSLAIHRMYAAGVMSLAALYRARVDELVATTGIDTSTCAAVVAAFQAYKRERAEQVPEPDHARERRRLRTLLDALADVESRFKAAEAAEDRVARRETRRQRAVLTRELDLVLAQIGELDLVTEVSRSSTARRIRRIDGWLRQPAASRAPSPTPHA